MLLACTIYKMASMSTRIVSFLDCTVPMTKLKISLEIFEYRYILWTKSRRQCNPNNPKSRHIEDQLMACKCIANASACTLTHLI
jgi:hypothetical protein